MMGSTQTGKDKPIIPFDLPEDDGLDHLRADVTGTMAKANPNDPQYLDKIDSSITALGHIDKMGKASTSMTDSSPFPGADSMASPSPPMTMGAPKKPGVMGRIGHVLAKMGNIAGDVFAPAAMAAIPGTDLNKRLATNRAAKQKLTQEEATSRENLEGAQADEAKARAESLRHPVPKEGLTPEETTIHDLMTGDNGQPRINPLTQKPYSYLDAYAAVKQAAQDVKPDKGKVTREITRVVNGVPHTIMVDAQTGEDIRDEGQTKIPGESAGDKRAANEAAQVERESRVNIRKAEGQYRDTQKSVGQLISSIDAAKDGNGLLTSFVPTMEVLGINAANGVHRISPAEAEAAKLPGGWAERFNAWFDKATTGKISPQLVAEGKALAKILGKSAYQRYKSTYDDESGIVSGYGGTGFDKRVPLLQEDKEEPARPANVPGNYIYKENGPKGKGWYKP